MAQVTARKKIGLSFAVAHLLAFFAVAATIRASHDGQAPLLWLAFAWIDFPISVLYVIPLPGYSEFYHSLSGSVLEPVFYLPHLIHGLLGTLWWYWVPQIVSPLLDLVRREIRKM